MVVASERHNWILCQLLLATASHSLDALSALLLLACPIRLSFYPGVAVLNIRCSLFQAFVKILFCFLVSRLKYGAEQIITVNIIGSVQ